MCLALAGILCWMGAMCQKENDTWYFGGRAGVSFSGGAAFGIPGGQMMQLEGAATISDGNGNLMMYTDGQSVWDRNHNVMPNGSGLLSGPSSAMAAVIVPQPCNQSRYYLFVVNDRTSGSMNPLSGLTYSIVDMSQNNGLGSIVSGQKNIL
ncbi:MAG TPA: hypothetical protein ENJ82_06890, partial [Bacteroidetes bacterium]|nr:hypothetical protein [Bacteroidota bacterium]